MSIKKKALLAGASGPLGLFVTQVLNREGHEITVRQRTNDLSALKDCIDHDRYGDITDKQSIVKATRDTESVFHYVGAMKMTGYCSVVEIHRFLIYQGCVSFYITQGNI